MTEGNVDNAVAAKLGEIGARLATVEKTGDDLKKSISDLSGEIRRITELSATDKNHASEIEKLWKEIAERDKKWDERIDRLANAHGSTRDKVNKILWISNGLSLSSMILAGLVGWIGATEIDRLDRFKNKIDDRMDSVEIDIARYHGAESDKGSVGIPP